MSDALISIARVCAFDSIASKIAMILSNKVLTFHLYLGYRSENNRNDDQLITKLALTDAMGAPRF